MSEPKDHVIEELLNSVKSWIEKEKAKSDLAGAIVIFDKLKSHCPVTREDIFTKAGQVAGGRGKHLKNVLSKYGVREKFLADGATTRATLKFIDLLEDIDYGKALLVIGERDRNAFIDQAINFIVSRITELEEREHLKISLNRKNSPISWIEGIIKAASKRSKGRVEQHMVGAKLETRLPNAKIGREAAHAGDVQTKRKGDFSTPNVAFHVTVAPTPSLIEKCRENITEGILPVILVPRSKMDPAQKLAQAERLEQEITIFAIEDFIAHNILEIGEECSQSLFDVLSKIIQVYNERIKEAETDDTLLIEIH